MIAVLKLKAKKDKEKLLDRTRLKKDKMKAEKAKKALAIVK
jgi:hypothetical protein